MITSFKYRKQKDAPMIALIAHDAQKGALLTFVSENFSFFQTQELIATGNTGKVLREKLGLSVLSVAHGPYGGDLVIGSRVVEGFVEAVIFFRDPLTAQPHEPDVTALMRVCDVHAVPLATNLATAQAIVRHLQSSIK